MTDFQPAAGFALGPDEGKPIWYLGGLVVFKITNEETGSWGLSVETFPAGFGSALHVHPTEDSGFYVLSGQMKVIIGGAEMSAGPGGFIFLPRNVPHAFKVGDGAPATWLNIQGPTGDFRRLVEETGEPAAALTLPQSTPPQDPEAANAARERHNLKMLGPSPF